MSIKARDINESTPWQEMTVGGEIYEGGTSAVFNTGDWRTSSPVWHSDKCRQCLLCAPWCPDSAIPIHEERVFTGDDAEIAEGDFSSVRYCRGDFDFYHCKGCGICMSVCPFKAITFEEVG